MSADLIPILDINLANSNLSRDQVNLTTTFSASQSRFGGNVGVGGFGYVGKVGVRGDIRWFKANSDNTLLGLDVVDSVRLDDANHLVELSGLKYWRASLGVAFRWEHIRDVAEGVMRPRRSEGRRTVSPPSATAISHRPIARLAATGRDRSSPAVASARGRRR